MTTLPTKRTTTSAKLLLDVRYELSWFSPKNRCEVFGFYSIENETPLYFCLHKNRFSYFVSKVIKLGHQMLRNKYILFGSKKVQTYDIFLKYVTFPWKGRGQTRVTPLMQTWDMRMKTLSVLAPSFLLLESANLGYIYTLYTPWCTQEVSPEMHLKWECYGMSCSTGEVVFIHSDKVDKTCPTVLILASSQG